MIAWTAPPLLSKPATTVAGFVLCGLVCAILAACAQDRPEPRVTLEFRGVAMGTTYSVKSVGRAFSQDDLARAREEVASVIRAIDDTMTTYRPSEITRFNAARDSGPHAISKETAEVVRIALDISAATDGAFDITVGPLVEAWGFGPERIIGAPESERLADARRRIGYASLTLAPSGTALSKSDPELEIDLSGIAKGYAVDRAADTLDALGHRNYMIEIGGEVRAKGRNESGRPWTLGIERPDAERGVVERIVQLRDMAMATSGDYRNYREVEGRRVSHILDPRSAAPTNHPVASATVLDRRCAVADALATAILVLGEGEGLARAEREGWAVLLLVRDGDDFVERWSTAFRQVVESTEVGGA